LKTTNTPLSHRKVILISIAIFVVILLLPVLIITTNKSARHKINIQTTTQTTVPPNPFPNGARAQQATYSIAIPLNSQTTSNTFTGGTTLIIQPPVGTYPGEPVFDVEAYNSKQNLTKKEMFYVATGASVNALVINGVTLPELKNTYQMRTINGKHIYTPTQLRIAYIVKPNALYVFRMYYSSDVTIPTDEDLFADFVKSFALK
jgi:hypothetical protein